MFHAMTCILLLSIVAGGRAEACVMEYSQIPVYEKQILKILDSLKGSEVKSLDQVAKPLQCLTKMIQEGSGQMRLGVTNTLYALIGGQSLPGESEAERKRFERSALMIKSLSSKDPNQADALNDILTGFLKGEWESYKLFCEKGDISHCLVFLPKENDVSAQDDLMAASSLMKWQIAHSKLDLKQRTEIEARMKNLYANRSQYSVLKRWFIEKIYLEMMPNEQPMSMVLS